MPRSPLPVGFDIDRLFIIPVSHKMSLNIKSSAGAGFLHWFDIFNGRRGRRRCTDWIRSGPIGFYTSDVWVPFGTTKESPESPDVIGEIDSRGHGDDLSSVILADQLVTNFNPGSNVTSPMSSQSACGHWNGRNPGGGTVDSARVSCIRGPSTTGCVFTARLSVGVVTWSVVRGSVPPLMSDTLAQKKPAWASSLFHERPP